MLCQKQQRLAVSCCLLIEMASTLTKQALRFPLPQVMTQKPKKTSQQRAEAREERSSNAKNRLKRQRKREKEVAAREALRKKL